MSDAPAPSQLRLARYGIGLGVIALAVVGYGITSRRHAESALEGAATDNGLPTVTVIRPDTRGGGEGVVLPGNVQAYNSAAIYPRTNGYLRRWTADIGDSVRAGQTLAVIDAPEVDQQLAQARADYQTAAANQSLARSTAARWDALLAKDAVSRQEADERRGALAANTALTNAQAANVRRLGALQGFTRVQAPFAGIVTSRSAQIGALVSASNPTATPLFTISDIRRVRIYVRVPQGYSGQVRTGMHAGITVPEYAGRSFDAVMTRSAGAVDPASGTVLIQLQADNPGGALKPGAYAQVTFPLVQAAGVRVPASALMIRESGPAVATIDGRGRIRIRPVTITRDDGATVAIGTGLTGGEQVVDTPPDAIADGDRVRIARAAPKKPAA